MRIALAALAVGLVTVLGGGVAANASRSEFSPYIFQVAWSPNGNWLVFAEYGSTGRFSISVVRLDRAVQRRIRDGLYLGAWSPDSKHIAFIDDSVPGAPTTWIVSANGLGLRSFNGLFQDWSPDSRSFLVTRRSRAYAAELYVVDSQTGASRFLAEGGGADWSPNGTRIAFTGPIRHNACFSGESRIFSVNVDGTDRRQLGGDGTPWTLQSIVGWAPDSSRLAYYESFPACDFPPTRATFIVPADGSRQSTEIGHGADLVAWSPGGRRFAVREREDDRLKIVTPDGATTTTFPSATGREFGWGPKGGSVVFSAGDEIGYGSTERIYTARANGTGRPRLLGVGTHPTWSALGWIAFAKRGSCTDGGERVYVERPDGSRFHVLSRCKPTG